MVITFKTGLVWFFVAKTCFNPFDRACSLVFSFSIALSLYKRLTIRLVGWNRTTRHKAIIYSKTCIHLQLINT